VLRLRMHGAIYNFTPPVRLRGVVLDGAQGLYHFITCAVVN